MRCMLEEMPFGHAPTPPGRRIDSMAPGAGPLHDWRLAKWLRISRTLRIADTGSFDSSSSLGVGLRQSKTCSVRLLTTDLTSGHRRASSKRASYFCTTGTGSSLSRSIRAAKADLCARVSGTPVGNHKSSTSCA